MKPIVGIPCYSQARQNAIFREASATQQTYIRALEDTNAVPLLLPITSKPEAAKNVIRCINGLLLVGGMDIDPKRYGQDPLTNISPIDINRDNIELTITTLCLTEHIPVLGICRGIQMLNVCTGGTLWQDIATQIPNAIKHDYYPRYKRNRLSHYIEIDRNNRLSEIFPDKTIKVNSLHHQAIRSIGNGFKVTATSHDNIIEGIESIEGSWTVGVQWHPEELINDDPYMKKLFSSFASACLAHLQGKKY